MRPARLIGLLGATYDYYVDTALGNDSNAGTAAAPWKTLSKLSDALAAGSTRTVLVRAGTYSSALDRVLLQPGSIATQTRLQVTFEPGCIMDGTAANAIAPTNGWEASGSAWTLVVFGNGLIVRNYSEPTAASPNGFGNRGSQIMIVHNAHCTNCDDGFSAHETAQMYTYDCSADGSEKGAFLHVDSAYVEHHRTLLRLTTNTNGNFGGAAARVKLFDCVVESSNSTVRDVDLRNTEVVGGRLGSLTVRLNLVSTGGDCAINDAYINAYVDGNSQTILTRAYGRFSTRARSQTGAGVRLRNCVFVGGATDQTNSVLFNSANFGSQGIWNAQDTILRGYSTAVGQDFNSTLAGYFVATGNFVRNCSFFANTTNIHASLIAAGADITGTVTADPLLGPANTYVQADYAVAANSPCVGAGVSGGNIGFTLADLGLAA